MSNNLLLSILQNTFVYMKDTYILHLYFKKEETNYYFGSRAAIFEVFTPLQLGISYNTLRGKRLPSEKEAFENEHCIIRRGKLIRKEKKETK